MLKIVIPMAGASTLFPESEYYYPKPLIEIGGKPTIQYVLENLLSIQGPRQFIFVVREDDCNRFHIDNLLRLLVGDCVVVRLKRDTQGALCSVLMAIDHFHESDELLLLNSDQIIECDYNTHLRELRENGVDVGLMVFESVLPRWSYARIDGDQVVETAEKNPISKNAMAGFYFFKRAGDFLRNAFSTIATNNSHNDLYFISPVVNQFVLEGAKVVATEIKPEHYVSFYSPRKLKEFEVYLAARG